MRVEDRRRNIGRITGLAIALSTPITAFVSFAFFASLLGEQNVEGSLIGTIALLVPALVGIALFLWAQFWLPLPGARVVAVLLAAFGVAALAIAIGSIVTGAGSGDANIGAALLIAGGLTLVGVALGVVLFDQQARKRAAEMPPPPSGPPASGSAPR